MILPHRCGVVFLSFFLAIPAFSVEIHTVADALRQLPPAQPRPRSIRPNIVTADSVGTAFILPVVGNTAGANGTYYRSEAIISNYLETPQRIAISILAQGKSSGNEPVIIRQLPTYDAGGDLGLVDENILQSLGKTGLAALVVQAVDANGNADPNARIDGFTRIWTNQPASDGCANPQGTVSESLLAVPTNSLSGSDFSGFANGLRQDENFRANVGIVNFSADAHTWTVEVDGTRGSTSFRMTVLPYSMEQTAVPAGIYGNMNVIFTADPSSAKNFNWAAYASSVDNHSADGWVRQASY